MHKASMIEKERRIISQMLKIIQRSDLIRANAVTMARVCGNKNCKCTKGEKHVSLYLSRSNKGKQRLFYIPRELETSAQDKIKRYQRFKVLLDELLKINWERIMKQKKA